MRGSKNQHLNLNEKQAQKKMRHKPGILQRNIMSALQVWLWLLIFVFQNEFKIALAAEPGYLDFDNLPETNFSCTGKVIGGYYADLETDCQMFHVCTIGQLEEPMDIKFLCLNGTVFDQETRVCERVDEVDCSKSEKFYSLNLELYGNTAPPIIKDVPKLNDDVDEEEYDEEIYDEIATTTKATTTTSTTTTTTTKRPTTPSRFFPTTSKPFYHSTGASYLPQKEDSVEEEDDDHFDIIKETNNTKINYQNNFNNNNNNNQQPQVKNQEYDSDKNNYNDYQEPEEQQNTSVDGDGVEIGDGDDEDDENPHIFSAQDFIYRHNKPANTNFKNPAISFQQHSFSSDGQNSHVTVTTHTGRGPFGTSKEKLTNKANNANPQLTRTYLSNSTPKPETKTYNEKSPYNSFQNFNNKKPSLPPNTNTQLSPSLPSIKHQNEPLYISFRKPALIPHGFQPSPASSKAADQSKVISKPQKPIQSYQPSERHEIALNTQYDFEKLTPSYPFIQDFPQFHFEQKRSQNSDKYEHEIASPKTTQPTTVTPTPYFNTWVTRSNNYTKSLPRVIVTASASVSDSNGKKLNYTVGNIVHAVKPLVHTNYDDYKESDVLLDPFFLDVPKLKKGRSRRSNLRTKNRIKRQSIITKYNPISITSTKQTTDIENPINNIVSTTQGPPKLKILTTIQPSSTVSPQSNFSLDPPLEFSDYVNDNYEPIVYKEKEPESTTNNKIKPHNLKPYLSTSVPSKFSNHFIFSDNRPFKTGNEVNKYFPSSTLTYLSKTTLDAANLETTTMSFLKMNQNLKFRVKSFNLVKVSDKSDNNKNVPCDGTKHNKFLADEKSCRTFHFCSNEFSYGQVLHIEFECELGKYFSDDLTHCSHIKPNKCV